MLQHCMRNTREKHLMTPMQPVGFVGAGAGDGELMDGIESDDDENDEKDDQIESEDEDYDGEEGERTYDDSAMGGDD
eukprot:4534970-Pleurochrysis_carterae.AAC.1